MLLRGVNDCIHVMKALVHGLMKIRVRPYYLYQCDLSVGIEHFRTSVGKGIEIIERLRGHTSGLAIPTFVVDAPGGGGKIPVMPQYMISRSDHKIIFRNYEGFISSYTEPVIDHEECPVCKQMRAKGGQEHRHRKALHRRGIIAAAHGLRARTSARRASSTHKEIP